MQIKCNGKDLSGQFLQRIRLELSTQMKVYRVNVWVDDDLALVKYVSAYDEEEAEQMAKNSVDIEFEVMDD